MGLLISNLILQTTLKEKTMRKIQSIFILFTMISIFLSACGGPTPTPSTMMDKPTDDMMMHETATSDAMMQETGTPAAMMEAPKWFAASLTDVRSGKTFSLNDFKGKVVLVETMAVWCSNCRTQQKEIKALHEKLGMQDDLVTLSLDIDPNENEADLKGHVDKYGFDWMYAVAPAQVVREIGDLYTQQFLNPPSTPILIVDRHGVAHPLPFGIKSADDLAKAVNMYLNEGM
jgi:cytochrome oxidase Cu insertion factor (SCO1/SenC/PrrC family)